MVSGQPSILRGWKEEASESLCRNPRLELPGRSERIDQIPITSCHPPPHVETRRSNGLRSSSSVVCSSARRTCRSVPADPCVPHGVQIRFLLSLSNPRAGRKTPQRRTTGRFPLKGGFLSNLATPYLHRFSGRKLQTVARTILSVDSGLSGRAGRQVLEQQPQLC